MIIGEVIGGAEVTRELEARHEVSGCKRYEMRCGCGRIVIRASNIIGKAKKFNRKILCPDCKRKQRLGHLDKVRRSRRGGYLTLWRVGGVLWSDFGDEAMENGIREEISSYLGVLQPGIEWDVKGIGEGVRVMRDCYNAEKVGWEE
jgi:hypothetical protein